MDTDKLRSDFDRLALGDLRGQVDNIVSDISTLIATRARTQSQAVLDFVSRRQGTHASEMIGRVQDAHFEGVRRNLLTKLELSVSDVILAYNKQNELELLSNAVTSSLLQVAALQAGAATAGGLAASHLLDPTGGLLFASGLALTGVVWLPLQRRRAKAGFRDRVAIVKGSMETALAQHLDRELRHVHSSIVDSIAPYSRFVRVERAKAETSVATIQAAIQQLQRLKAEVTGA
eukprot:20635-Heterococcus_DN1.PRE.2